MAFQADQKVKVEIIRCLGTEQLFRLLSDPDSNVLMKTLGLLRNLLSTRPVQICTSVTGKGGWGICKRMFFSPTLDSTLTRS